ncbi:MAG: IclR family transcriptional regulator [Leifsonia sp.]|nr:IclR family transcriptional regulator [Leifsonia sp.]
MRAAEEGRSVAGRLFAIADAFEGGRELTLSEIAQRAQLPLSTAHRLVAEWVEWGGLVRGDDGRYQIGLRLWRLGVRQPAALRLRTVARPFLDDLLDATGEHVHLAVIDGAEATYLERLSAPGAVPVISAVAARLPLHATGVGLSLLAHAGDDLVRELLAAGLRRFAAGTPTTEAALRTALAQARASGVARSVDALTPGALSLAAAVRDSSGEVIAAVSIVVSREREGDASLPHVVRLAALGISGALGWRP